MGSKPCQCPSTLGRSRHEAFMLADLHR